MPDSTWVYLFLVASAFVAGAMNAGYVATVPLAAILVALGAVRTLDGVVAALRWPG